MCASADLPAQLDQQVGQEACCRTHTRALSYAKRPCLTEAGRGRPGPLLSTASVWNSGWPYHRKVEGYGAFVLATRHLCQVVKGGSQAQSKDSESYLTLIKQLKVNPSMELQNFYGYYANADTLIYAYEQIKSNPGNYGRLATLSARVSVGRLPAAPPRAAATHLMTPGVSKETLDDIGRD